MSRTIHIDTNQHNRDFERLLDQIYMQFHCHPTNIPRQNLSDYERQLIAEYDAMAKRMGSDYGGSHGGGTVYHGDPDYCNGLPRRR